MYGFDRPRQTWQCSIITDCWKELSWFCQLAVPTVWWLLWGTADTKSLSSTFLWAGAWSQMTSAQRRKTNSHQLFITTPQPGKCVVQGHTRDPQPGNQSPCRSPAPWAIVTNDLCIRRCRARSNNATPVNISDEQPPHYFFNIIICCTCNMCP